MFPRPLIALLTALCASLLVAEERALAAPPAATPTASEGLLGAGLFNIFGTSAPSAPGSETSEAGDAEAPFFQIVPSLPTEVSIVSEGSTTYEAETQRLTFRDQVIIEGDNGLRIYANEAEVDKTQERIITRGNVSIFSGPLLYHGEEAIYYYKTRKIDTKDVKTSHDPFLLEAERLYTVQEGDRSIQIAENARVTTDDYQNPSYWIAADKVAMHPNELIVFEQLRLQVGGRTIFWLPYLAHSLNQDLGYHFTPGAKSHLGLFLRNRYGIYLGGQENAQTLKVDNPSHLLHLHVDPYTRRGIGIGVDLYDMQYREYEELGHYGLYWIYDLNPHIERTERSRSSLDQHSRLRLVLKDRQELGTLYGRDLRLDTNLTYLSDAFFLEDFYEHTYTSEPEPDNTIALTHTGEQSLATVQTRFQLNHFQEVDARLPEATFSRVRSSLWDTPLLYESQSSLGYYRRLLSDDQRSTLRSALATAPLPSQALLRSLLDEEPYFRAHTWHELSRPYLLLDGVTLTPRAGIGYTAYHSDTVQDDRWAAHLGLDLSAKLSRDYPTLASQTFGIKGLRHLIQPYLNLSYLRTTDLDLGSLQTVDNLTPITRPRPIHVGRYSAIDALEDWFIVRTGVRQSLLTQRDGSPYEWLYLDTYCDFLPAVDDTVNSLSNLYTELSWAPLPWVELNLEAQFPIANTVNDFREIYLHTSFHLNSSAQFQIGVQFLENHPIINDITQLNYRYYQRLSDRWGMGIYHNWRLDEDILTLQEYSVYRNLQSWVLSLDFYHRDYSVDSEWGITFGFTLRDFPDISLPLTLEQ